MSKKGGGSIKYFSEDSAGFRIQPKTVLIMSLIYIGIVVLLHIFAKMGGEAPKNEAPEAPSQEPSGESAQQ